MRERRYCKDCGGVSICQHGKRRSRCKDCGGGSICQHGKRRVRCKDCKGVTKPVVVSKKRKRNIDTPELCDDGEDVDESPVCMDPFGGSAPNETDAFVFNVTESTTPIPASLGSSEMPSLTAAMVNNFMSDSMVPLVDVPEHGIMPLGEDEEDPSFLIIVEASVGGGLLLPGPST